MIAFPKSDDPLAEVLNAPAAASKQPPASYNGGKPEGKLFERACGKCGGTGKFRSFRGNVVGQCFACKGAGKFTTKTDTVKAGASRAKKLFDKIEAFKAAYPDVWAWMDGSTFPPAVEMREALGKYGDLYESRIEAARRMIAARDAKLAEVKAERIEREAGAQAVNVSALEEAFAKAAASNKRTALWIGSVRIKPARGKPGVLYVSRPDTDQYLGKIEGGKYVPSREAAIRSGLIAEVHKILQDPKAAAIEHGKLTGACAVCSRTLSDPESVKAGIGPVCATKMGW